jgi:putative lipoic acid-binding regulatory protein
MSKPFGNLPDSAAETPSLIEFPCDFPIKIMGTRHDAFAQSVLDVVIRHAPDFDAATTEMRVSKGGKYLSLTCTVRATSKTQLDALYMELTQHPDVKVVL